MALTKLDPNVIGTDSSGTSKLTSAGGSAQLYSTGLFAIANNSANNFNVASNGYVGVGTTSPSYLLHVKPASGSPVVTAEGVGTAQAGFFAAIGADSGSYPGFRTYQGASHYWSIHQRGDTNLHLYKEAGSGAVVVDNSNLLIGTTNSDIGGSVAGLRVAPTGDLISSIDGGSLANYQAPIAADRRNVAGDGLMYGMWRQGIFQCGIGATNTQAMTFITGNGSNTTQTERLRIESNGRIGVAMSANSATEVLDVVGSIQIRNDLSGASYTGGLRFAHTGAANTAAYIQQGGQTGNIGMTSGDITVPSGTSTMLARTHWGGLALVGYAGTGQQGYRIVAMGYGTAPTVLYSASWAGSATITFSQSDYRLFVSQSIGSAMSFWCIFLGV